MTFQTFTALFATVVHAVIAAGYALGGEGKVAWYCAVASMFAFFWLVEILSNDRKA
jgi:hypothetical protein